MAANLDNSQNHQTDNWVIDGRLTYDNYLGIYVALRDIPRRSELIVPDDQLNELVKYQIGWLSDCGKRSGKFRYFRNNGSSEQTRSGAWIAEVYATRDRIFPGNKWAKSIPTNCSATFTIQHGIYECQGEKLRVYHVHLAKDIEERFFQVIRSDVRKTDDMSTVTFAQLMTILKEKTEGGLKNMPYHVEVPVGVKVSPRDIVSAIIKKEQEKFIEAVNYVSTHDSVGRLLSDDAELMQDPPKPMMEIGVARELIIKKKKYDADITKETSDEETDDEDMPELEDEPDDLKAIRERNAKLVATLDLALGIRSRPDQLTQDDLSIIQRSNMARNILMKLEGNEAWGVENLVRHLRKDQEQKNKLMDAMRSMGYGSKEDRIKGGSQLARNIAQYTELFSMMYEWNNIMIDKIHDLSKIKERDNDLEELRKLLNLAAEANSAMDFKFRSSWTDIHFLLNRILRPVGFSLDQNNNNNSND